jgi:hypothetical protein
MFWRTGLLIRIWGVELLGGLAGVMHIKDKLFKD